MTVTTAPKLRLSSLGLSYPTVQGRKAALHAVDLQLADGEFLALVGPSGCGKSTLLKLVAGLLSPTAGEIDVDGRRAEGGRVPDGVGMVFQNDALLPWRSVVDNIRLPLELQGQDEATQRRRADELIELVGLTGFGDYRPRALSGGMRKRVALARTIAYDPDVYLMDEPFGPLDAQTRVRLGGEFLDIWEQLGKSVIFVTHDVEEAIALSDRVAVMSAGPGTIAAEFDVDLPRPRDFHEVRFTPEFQELHRAVWNALEDQIPAETPRR